MNLEHELCETLLLVAVENIKQWWLRLAGIPTKADYILINMILNLHKDCTILFKLQATMKNNPATTTQK